MPINTGKILTISAQEYCHMTIQSIAEFYPLGLHIPFSKDEDPLEKFNAYIPNNAEAVVGFRLTIYGDVKLLEAYHSGFAYGTVLIPK
jgi:hypothetical protein